ncbi:MAG: membrane protein insertion efficiency factor YidD [Deltaproteobacteria bacterium]|nr:membrane protein insertion efficiency factor YidD [Deltaproteobacteria bacterium]
MFKRVLEKIIKGYQIFFSPWLGGECRFHPSCSEYARLSLFKYRWDKALWMAVRRVFKCHPFHEGGIDLP